MSTLHSQVPLSLWCIFLVAVPTGFPPGMPPAGPGYGGKLSYNLISHDPLSIFIGYQPPTQNYGGAPVQGYGQPPTSGLYFVTFILLCAHIWHDLGPYICVYHYISMGSSYTLSIQEYTRVCMSIQEYTRVYKSILEYA